MAEIKDKLDRGHGRLRSDTNNDDVLNEVIDNKESSDRQDYEVDGLTEYRKKRRPDQRKRTTSVADDDTKDTDDDEEDAEKENGEKTCKRGRLTRSMQKSTTNSPKKSSGSSQVPVTVISIETDEESDEDSIKPPTSSTKKKIYSSDDSDAAGSDSDILNSSAKRKSLDDDDDDDDNDDDDDDDDGDKSNDEKNVKESSKKTHKRIKTTYTSSQETEKSVDQEEQDDDNTPNADEEDDSSSSSSGSDADTSSSCSSSSDTHSYTSANGNINGTWVEESLVEDTYIQQLKEIQKDDDGTMDMLRHYILWFSLKAGGVDIDEFYKETIDAKIKLEGRLETVMNICQSQAWGENFRKDVMTYPQFNVDVKREDLSGGDMRHLENCEVCNRESHPWSVIVNLEGEPYDSKTFETIEREEGEDSEELPPVQYYMGCFCHPRTKLFHKLFHFGHYLYHRCKDMLEDLGDDEKKIDTVATDKSLLNEMHGKIEKWMQKAERDYTIDGERGNNKWTREYKNKDHPWVI